MVSLFAACDNAICRKGGREKEESLTLTLFIGLFIRQAFFISTSVVFTQPG